LFVFLLFGPSLSIRSISDLLHSAIAVIYGISVGAVGVSIHRLRKRYAEVLREEISQTVSTPEDVDDEIRHLIAAVGT
jgi:RNA polymerase sigma-70 factor (ECF subfamily)